MSQNADLVKIFLQESRDYIEELDQQLIQLEAEPENDSLMREIFRAFHTLKGSAGLVGLPTFEKVAHAAEDLLGAIRDKGIAVTTERISFLLDALDCLKILHTAVEKQGNDAVEIELPDMPMERLPAQAKTRSVATNESTIRQVMSEICAPDGSWGLFQENLPHTGAAEAERATQAESSGEPSAEGEEKLKNGNAPDTVDQAPPDGESKISNPSQQQVSLQNWNRGDGAVRVDIGLLDKLMNQVGELVLARNRLRQVANRLDNPEFYATCQRLNLITGELQESVMKTRMQPIGNLFHRFPRVLRDLCRELGKEVELFMEGQETELDRTIIEAIRDPLMHIIRNAADHGIEQAEERLAAGKPAAGAIHLRARHEGGQVVIEVADDGRGIDIARVREIAVARGILSSSQADSLSESDALQLLSQPGFSTAAHVTNLSGRGVGMDIVKTHVEKIGGSVELRSELGAGTTVLLKIPLTLAIIPALIVHAGDQRFAIPQVNLVELVQLDRGESSVEVAGDAIFYRLRGHLLPLLSLADVLQLQDAPANPPESQSIVVLSVGQSQFGLIVDHIHDTEEIVVKPLSQSLKKIVCYAGATVMGDGRVALILDVPGLARLARLSDYQNVQKTAVERKKTRGDGQDRTFLLFRLDRPGNRQFAVPLPSIARFESFPLHKLQRLGRTEAVVYRNAILPLLRLEPFAGLPGKELPDPFTVLVFRVDERDFGLPIAEVLDVVTVQGEVALERLRGNVFSGSLVLNDKITLILDVGCLAKTACPWRFEVAKEASRSDAEDWQTAEPGSG